MYKEAIDRITTFNKLQLPSEKLKCLQEAFECARLARLCTGLNNLPNEAKLLVLKELSFDQLILLDYTVMPSPKTTCVISEAVSLIVECV